MTKATIFAALRLSSGVLSSLQLGNVTAIHAQSFYKSNQDFALFANDAEDPEVEISAWAHFERSQKFFEKDKCDILAARLQVPIESLQTAIEQNGFIWLSYLRVYYLPSPIIVKNSTKGVFIALENRVYINKLQPVLDDSNYEKRKREVENLEPPEPLDVQIQKMLEEVEFQRKVESLEKIDWINLIAKIGNSSDGNQFEKLVRKSMLKLGFTGSGLDPDGSGGAGGMDLYAEFPYPIVGECKATKTEKVSDGTPAQLLKIGMNHLGKDLYDRSIKLIVAAGEFNDFAKRTARENSMNVLRPETLERLVQLKARHDGSINLQELKNRLTQNPLDIEDKTQTPFGVESDQRINAYVDEVEQELKLRSQIVQTVKEEQDGNQYVSVTEIRSTYNAKYVTDPKQRLNDVIVKDLLIELSSPLAGYLGRDKGDERKGDRFYYLRDLPI